MLRHAANSKGVATLVVPEWPSSPYWPMLCSDGLHLAGFVHMWMHIPPSADMTLPGRRSANIFKAGQPNTDVFALRLDFIQPPRQGILHEPGESLPRMYNQVAEMVRS